MNHKAFAGGKPCPITEHAKNNPVQSDLTKYRCWEPILTPDEERELVRQAQTGDVRTMQAAKDGLVRRYQRKLLKIAGQFYGPPFEERLSAAQQGLLKAIHNFDLRRNVRLATAVGTYAANEVRTFVKSHYPVGACMSPQGPLSRLAPYRGSSSATKGGTSAGSRGSRAGLVIGGLRAA